MLRFGKQLLFTPVTVTSNLMELKAIELRPIDRDAVVKSGDSWEFRFPESEKFAIPKWL